MLLNFKYLTLLRVFLIALVLSLTVYSFPSLSYGDFTDTYILLTPPIVVASKVGETFIVSLDVLNVDNLYSFEFTITYNATLLDAVHAWQGPFFPQHLSSHFEWENNESLGSVKVNMSLVEPEMARSGNGTLTRISFRVVQDPKSCVSSPLNLQQTMLFSSTLTPIAHDFVGAVYFWKSLLPDPPLEGRLLDLYTQEGGEGPYAPGGEFTILEVVCLTSDVTYNLDPVAAKLVSFELRNPLNESVVFRVAKTNQDGIAVICFRIPPIPESNGTWTAISIVEIAGKTVWDTISFQVSFLPLGGKSFPIKEYTTEKSILQYVAPIMVLAAAFTIIRNNKRKILNRCKF